jgi:hypothetical protein
VTRTARTEQKDEDIMERTLSATDLNRRGFIRITPEHNAPIRVDINGADFIETIRAVDISENGIGITVPHGFHGCHVDLPASFVIHLPQPINKAFRVDGMIRHVRQNSFGVNFTNMNDKSKALVRQYIGLALKKRGMWDYFKYLMGIQH